MANRTRPIRIEICVTEQERQLIRHKMAQLGTKNVGAYARKMLIDGYIIKVDYTEQKKVGSCRQPGFCQHQPDLSPHQPDRSLLRRGCSRIKGETERNLGTTETGTTS